MVSPANARFQVMDAVPLPGTPNPAGNSKNPGIQKLAIHLLQTTGATIAVAFSEAGAQPEPVIKALDTW